jgi:hypothetical protein
MPLKESITMDRSKYGWWNDDVPELMEDWYDGGSL